MSIGKIHTGKGNMNCNRSAEKMNIKNSLTKSMSADPFKSHINPQAL